MKNEIIKSIGLIKQYFLNGKNILQSKPEYMVISLIYLSIIALVGFNVDSGTPSLLLLLAFFIFLCVIGRGFSEKSLDKLRSIDTKVAWRMSYIPIVIIFINFILSPLIFNPPKTLLWVDSDTGQMEAVSTEKLINQLAKINLTNFIKNSLTVTNNRKADDLMRDKANSMVRGISIGSKLFSEFRSLDYLKTTNITNTVEINSIKVLGNDRYEVTWTETLLDKSNNKKPVESLQKAVFDVEWKRSKDRNKANFYIKAIDPIN